MDSSQKTLKGFTLVELLITISIMAMVIGTATYGFSLFANRWGSGKQVFRESVSALQRVELLNDSLMAAVPWIVRDDRGQPGFYFLGREEGLTLITDSPIFSAGGLAVIRVFREAEAGGQWRLVYEEAPIENVPLREASQTLPFKHRLVVARGVGVIRFRFFGWRSAQARAFAEEEGVGEGSPEWSEEFDGLTRKQHPLRIGIRLGTDEVVYDIPDKGAITLRRLVGDP